MEKRINYRRLAFETYDPVCACCGFAIASVLEVAHLDGNRANNDIGNLAILCPNCHKMHDLDIIPTPIVRQMRDRPKMVNWRKRMKDAGAKAAMSRKRRIAAQRRKRRLAARKAVATRQQNRESAR